MPFAWINGSFVDESAASVSARDTGLLHGIGVFTTMRARGGQVVRLDRHLKRLRQSCEELFIPLLYKDGELSEAISELLARNELSDARMRLTITRGTTVTDPLHGLHAQPTALLTAGAFEPYPAEYYEKGLTATVLDKHKLNPYDITAGHKTLDYFARLSALRDASKQGAAEALWFNVHNYLQSGCISNVFVVKGGSLITPPTNEELREPLVKAQTAYPQSNVLPGTTRGAVLDRAKSAGIGVRLGTVTINDLLDADEVFLTNSVMGVMPVTHIERRAIGSEKPGEITQQLAALLESAD
jgi:branched-chain amino acid aminotransferase